MSKYSSISAVVRRVTTAPLYGTLVISPSVSSSWNAARTGMWLTPSRLATSSWRSGCPWAYSFEMMSSRSESATWAERDLRSIPIDRVI